MRSPLSDRSRQRLRTTATIVVTALVIAPAAALATHGFNDVDDGDFFHAAVDWMKDNNVTVGCNPPDNTRYCPNDFVTRGEMAVFLERLDSEGVFLRPGEASGGDGGDADTLDGKDSTAFLGTGAKAADADKLDGKNSTAFATAAGLADLDTFIPVATFSVLQGSMGPVDFRDPITSTPTVSGSNGQFTVDLPGFSFSILTDAAVCSGTVMNVYAYVGSDSGNMVVRLTETDGTPGDDAGSEDDFTCAVYDHR